jgi:hypothetical protein
VSRESLDRAVLELIDRGVDAPADDAEFDRLARALFAHQFAQNAPYRRLCQAQGVTGPEIPSWRDIPAVPTGAFKEARLASFPPERELRVFRTSGSTTGDRGALHLDTLELYERSLLATFGSFVCPDVERIRFAVLGPSDEEAPDSSLAYMFGHGMRRLGAPGSAFWPRRETWAELLGELARAREPVLIAGAAFAFVHLLDFMAERGERLALPPGSRALETGGFKGRSRVVSRDELHGGIAASLGVPRARIVNQYGMCELGSQFYEPTLRTGEPSARKRVPPWVRTRAVDPASLADVAPGERGVLLHCDLANTGSVLAVLTSDEGVTYPGAKSGEFEVLGRIAGAEARGCSIAADALLAAR